MGCYVSQISLHSVCVPRALYHGVPYHALNVPLKERLYKTKRVKQAETGGWCSVGVR